MLLLTATGLTSSTNSAWATKTYSNSVNSVAEATYTFARTALGGLDLGHIVLDGRPISDACTGVSMGFGRAMGLDEAVTPVLPNSDYCTGIAGACGVLEALILRAEKGGSVLVSIAINYYNKWLVDHVGEYEKEIWEELWSRNGRQVFRHHHSMNYTAPEYLKMFQQQGLLNLDFFEVRESKALGGIKFRVPRPVLQFPKGTIETGYNVGTRGNGVDQARWPEDLMTEVVT